MPVGRHDRPRIADRARLAEVSRALANPRVRLLWGSFEKIDRLASRDDFLYIDPPYAPLSRTANFTAYTASPFDQSDQRRLQQLPDYEHEDLRISGFQDFRILGMRTIEQ